MYNGNRFSFAQMTSTEGGKTSASGTMGVLIVVVGCLAFLLGAVDRIFFSHSIDIMTQTIVFTGIGAGLLGLKKWKATGKDSSFSSEVDEPTISAPYTPYQQNPPYTDPGSYYQGGYPQGTETHVGNEYNVNINYRKSQNTNQDPL